MTRWYMMQGSPHIVKTGRLDFSLSWLKGKVRENLGDFRKLIQILTFLSPLPLLHNDLKKDAVNEFEIKYWTSNPVWVKFHEILCEYWRKSMIIGEKNTDLKRLTKTSLFDRNWAISLKPRRRSHPLRMVWWALVHHGQNKSLVNWWEDFYYPHVHVDLHLHSNTLSWLRVNQSLLIECFVYNNNFIVLFESTQDDHTHLSGQFCFLSIKCSSRIWKKHRC